MFLANVFNTTNGKSDSFPVEMENIFRKNKNIKNNHSIFSKGLDIYNDQIYNLRAIIEGAGYDINIETIVDFFKKAYQNIFSVKKRCISYYEYLDDTHEKWYEDYKTEYSVVSSVAEFQFIIRGSDTTELKNY